MLLNIPDPDVRQLAREIIEAVERSQAEIGGTLHDTLCQTLSGATLMARVLAGRAADAEVVSAAELTQLCEMLDRSLDGARTLLHRLQPLEAGPTALMNALQRLAAEAARTVPCQFHCVEPVLVNDVSSALTLYRVADAAVRDALGPPAAAHLRISLSAKDGEVEVAVSTAGFGTQPPPAESSRLRLMRYRAEAAGGILQIKPAAAGGTHVTCRLLCGD